MAGDADFVDVAEPMMAVDQVQAELVESDLVGRFDCDAAIHGSSNGDPHVDPVVGAMARQALKDAHVDPVEAALKQQALKDADVVPFEEAQKTQSLKDSHLDVAEETFNRQAAKDAHVEEAQRIQSYKHAHVDPVDVAIKQQALKDAHVDPLEHTSNNVPRTDDGTDSQSNGENEQQDGVSANDTGGRKLVGVGGVVMRKHVTSGLPNSSVLRRVLSDAKQSYDNYYRDHFLEVRENVKPSALSAALFMDWYDSHPEYHYALPPSRQIIWLLIGAVIVNDSSSAVKAIFDPASPLNTASQPSHGGK